MEIYKNDVNKINSCFVALDKAVSACPEDVKHSIIIEVVSEKTVIGSVGYFNEEGAHPSFRGKYQ